MIKGLSLVAALLCAGCPESPRTMGRDIAPQADLAVVYDFASSADFTVSPDFAVGDFGKADGAPADLALTDGGKPGDLASPPDLALPKASLEIQFCVIQFPKTLASQAGLASAPIFGQVFQGGLTDATQDKPAPGIIAQLGVGPLHSDPRLGNAWKWAAALPTPQYDWKQNNDEYQAPLTVAAIGIYSYAFRFSVTGGAGFTYCDTVGNGGNNGLPGFDPAKTGQITVN
ncbi:MAG: hypothetical protein EXR72_20060 [Myxococcales bacterium]|nr:hypothetical protein [Myxococcales bacterium]